MTEKLCRKCHERPIHIKKRKLCNRCYQRDRNEEGPFIDKESQKFCERVMRKHQLSREIEFIKNFFTHTDYIHYPATFRLNGANYSPDFYDGHRNIWIEVSGTRQAYSANREKYKLFRQLFPDLKFEIRKPIGELLNEDEAIHPQLLKQ